MRQHTKKQTRDPDRLRIAYNDNDELSTEAEPVRDTSNQIL